MRNILAIFFVMILSAAWSQEGFRPGYVIGNGGDTIRGKIKDRRFLTSSVKWQKIEFISEKGMKIEYTPFDATEYKKGESLFRTLSIGIEVEKTFLEVEQSGPVILYSLNHGSGWGAAGNGIAVKLPGQDHDDRVEFFLQNKNDPNSLMQWRPRDYVITAKQFFKADTALIREVEQEKLQASDIKEIVKRYNEWKTGKQ